MIAANEAPATARLSRRAAVAALLLAPLSAAAWAQDPAPRHRGPLGLTFASRDVANKAAYVFGELLRGIRAIAQVDTSAYFLTEAFAVHEKKAEVGKIVFRFRTYIEEKKRAQQDLQDVEAMELLRDTMYFRLNYGAIRGGLGNFYVRMYVFNTGWAQELARALDVMAREYEVGLETVQSLTRFLAEVREKAGEVEWQLRRGRRLNGVQLSPMARLHRLACDWADAAELQQLVANFWMAADKLERVWAQERAEAERRRKEERRVAELEFREQERRHGGGVWQF
jgi:hypothetical protein